MSAKERRKLYGVRRESRRSRSWTRWFREGILDAEVPQSPGIRVRTAVWGQFRG